MQIVVASRDVLYHKTNQRSLVSILRSGSFVLKPSDGTAVEDDIGVGYYLSTARTPYNDYSKNSLMSNSVMIVLDGAAIAKTHKIKPVNYWGNKEKHTGRNEMEERIFSRTPRLSAKYIKAVHSVALEESANWGPQHILNQERMRRLLIKRGIPLYFYSNAEDLLKLRPSTRVDPPAKMSLVEKNKPMTHYERTFKTLRRRKNDIVAWLELYKRPAPADTDDGIYKALKRRPLSDQGQLKYSLLGYPDDAVRSLNADLHNAKGTDPSGTSLPGEREHLEQLVAVFRKNKWRSADFVKAMQAKWRPINKPKSH